MPHHRSIPAPPRALARLSAWALLALAAGPGAIAGPAALPAPEATQPPAAAEAPAPAEAPARLTFDVLFAPDAAGRLPRMLEWSPDGSRLAYLWKRDGEDVLEALAPATGETATLLVPGEHTFAVPGEDGDEEAEPSALELAAYHWAPDGGSLLIESSGDLFLWKIAARELARLTETEAEEEEPKFSPDGSRVAFVRDADLWLLDLATGAERALTTGGEEDAILNGKTDWVYWEEIWNRDSTGFWWSPKGDKIAYYRFDESPVATYPLVDWSKIPYPGVRWQKYPKAGEPNPMVRVGVVDLASGETVWLETGEETDVYLARVDWLPAGDRVAVQVLNREQTRLELLSCEPAGGTCAKLHGEEWPTWINLTLDLHFLPDGGFVWSSEKSGWRRLYLHGADGRELRPLSPDGWSVDSVAGVDVEAGVALYTAFPTGELGALGRRVFRQPLAAGPARPLSDADGWSSARPAPSGAAGGYWVHTWSDADRPAAMAVRDAEGREVARLPSEAPAGYQPEELPAWEFLTIPGPDGLRLPAALLRPAGLDGREPGKLHPAIMYHYGGPASQVVVDRWSGRGRGLWHKMMAQRGYAVLMVDNAASTFFGKRGEDRLHRRFGEHNLAAQLAGVGYLKSLGWVDAGRIGLWGWSGGGSNTLYSTLKSPGTWKAAVAGAPVTDWRLYDTIWTERYLDRPQDNPDGYRDSSTVTWAGELADELLIVHGTADDNVHPHNTIAMTRALIDAGKPFEEAIHPGQKHGFRGRDSRHFFERMTRFFDRVLGEEQ